MSIEDSEGQRKLDKLIRESKQKGIEIAKLTGNVAQWAHEISDLADASVKVIQYAPSSGFDWESRISAWRHLLVQQGNVYEDLTRFSLPPVTASGSAAAFSMLEFANPSGLVSKVPPDRQEAAHNDAEQLGHVLDRVADKRSLLGLMHQIGLNIAASGKISAVELFETAYAAFEKPVTTRSPASTSLIPMREAIKETVEFLLRRRPQQEPTRNEHTKIISIGNQLAHDGTKGADIESWANRWSHKGGLLDELSGSKDKDLNRDQWQHLLRKATLWLAEFLQSLDYAKFR